jgi:DNA-binding NarL/FixJ family response regulator
MPEALLNEQEIAPPADPEAPTVLAVGLDSEDRVALRRILAGKGWHLREAHGCHEALVILSNQVVPVVLCECELPVGNWKDLLASLQSLAPSPCLVVSTRMADTRLWAEVLNLGGDDLLMAPFSPNDVLRVLDLTLQRWRRKWQSSPMDTSQPHPSWLFEDLDVSAVERKIAVLAVQGFTDSEIALSLHMKEAQVKSHLLEVCSKLNVPDRLALVIYAIDRAMRNRSASRALARSASAGVPMLTRGVA